MKGKKQQLVDVIRVAQKFYVHPSQTTFNVLGADWDDTTMRKHCTTLLGKISAKDFHELVNLGLLDYMDDCLMTYVKMYKSMKK